MRFALALLCLVAAGCTSCPPLGLPPPSGLVVTSGVAFILTTPTITACIDSYCDVVTVHAPTTSPVPLPHARGSLEIANTPGGMLVTLVFDEGDDVDAGPAVDLGTTISDGGVDAHIDAAVMDAGTDAGHAIDASTLEAGTGTGGHAHDGSAVYLLIFEPTYARNIAERAAPVPPKPSGSGGAGCDSGWSMSL